MASEEEIQTTIGSIVIPLLGRTVGNMNLVRSVKCTDHLVEVKLSASCIDGPAQNKMKSKVKNQKSK